MVEGKGVVEVRAGGMLRETVLASAMLAAAAILVSGLLGDLTVGLGLGTGLLIGSANGYLIIALLNRGVPFVAASMFRLVTFSVLMVTVAILFGVAAWPVMMGAAGAQLVMVAAGVRQGLRA